MHTYIASRRRGSVIAIVLMALIAAMALLVVFLSRSGRSPYAKAANDHVAPSTLEVSHTTTTQLVGPQSAMDDPMASGTFTDIVIPPPPPTAPTPDTRNLPPEG